jgi:hypothetical protein
MTDQEVKRRNAVAEATTIIAGLNELLMKLESERTPEDEQLYNDTIKYVKIVRSKYYQLSKTPMMIDNNGDIVPTI